MTTVDTTPAATARPTRAALLGTGAAALVLGLTALFAAVPEPEDGQATNTLRAFYESQLTAAGVAVFAGTLATGAFVLLVVGLRRLLSEARANTALIDLMTVSGTLLALWFWMGSAQGAMTGVMANDSGKLVEYDDQALAHLDLFSRFTETFGDVGMVVMALFLGAVSWAAVTTRFMPRWIGYFGLVVTAGCAISLVGMVWREPVTSTGFFVGLFGFFLWTLMTGVALCVGGVRRGR